MSLLEETFLYQALGKTNFLLVVVGLPIGFLAYQMYQNKEMQGDTNKFALFSSGTIYDQGANLAAKARKNNGGYSLYQFNKYFNGEQKATNFQ